MKVTSDSSIRRGVTRNLDPRQAAQDLHAAIYQENAVLGVFYCSPSYDLPALGRELREVFGDFPLVGCTTAGEITPEGYLDGSLTGVSFASPDFEVAIRHISDLSRFEVQKGKELGIEMLADLYSRGFQPSRNNSFGYLMIDGLSTREELVTSALHQGFGDIRLMGGSAADGIEFGETLVFCNGAFHQDSAVATLVQTKRPFRIFKTDHFSFSDRKLVVTEANPSKRIVSEINGLPAYEEYARQVGVATGDLSPLVFSSHPVLIRAGGENYVRSIQQVNPDGSLTFFCTIDEGIVLTVADGESLVGDLKKTLMDVEKELGGVELILASDCVLRNLEMKRECHIEEVGDLLKRFGAVGFSTYGEQFNGMHVNQTLTGIAIG